MNEIKLKSDEDKLIEHWKALDHHKKTDIRNAWYNEKEVRMILRDAESLYHDIAKLYFGLSEGKHEKNILLSQCADLVRLLKHVQSNKAWYHKVYSKIKFLIDTLNSETGSYNSIRDLILALLRYYNVGPLVNFEMISTGQININVRLVTTKGTYYVRAYTEDRSQADIEKEHQLLEYLSKKGLVVSPPLKARDGRSYIYIGKRHCALFEWIKGKHPKLLNIGRIRKVAEKLATYHNLVTGYHPNTRAWKHAIEMYPYRLQGKLELVENDIFSGNTSILERLQHQTRLSEVETYILPKLPALYKSFKECKAVVSRVRFPPEDFVLNHRDIHPGNLLFEGEDITGVLDFGSVSYDPKQWELVITAYRFSEKRHRTNLKKLVNFVGAYRSIDRNLYLPPELAYQMIQLLYFLLLYNHLHLYYQQKEHMFLFPTTKEYLKGVKKSTELIEWGVSLREEIMSAFS